jgi:hypothetical protein
VVNSVTLQRHTFAQPRDSSSLFHLWAIARVGGAGAPARRMAARLVPESNPASRYAVLASACGARRGDWLPLGPVASGGCRRGDAAVRSGRRNRSTSEWSTIVIWAGLI